MFVHFFFTQLCRAQHCLFDICERVWQNTKRRQTEHNMHYSAHCNLGRRSQFTPHIQYTIDGIFLNVVFYLKKKKKTIRGYLNKDGRNDSRIVLVKQFDFQPRFKKYIFSCCNCNVGSGRWVMYAYIIINHIRKCYTFKIN